MDHSEKYTGSKEDFYFFLKDEVIRLFTDKLKIDGTRVLIPDNEQLDYKFKIDSDINYGVLTIEVKWGEKQPNPSNKLNQYKYEELDENSDGMVITTDISFN
ncbi:hypothetical protein [Clostridium sp.]|uniref:hypothetical protein n=1 Tax=Clostridium sp. TaxID=1506 RepID=UPI003D6CC2F6